MSARFASLPEEWVRQAEQIAELSSKAGRPCWPGGTGTEHRTRAHRRLAPCLCVRIPVLQGSVACDQRDVTRGVGTCP